MDRRWPMSTFPGAPEHKKWNLMGYIAFAAFFKGPLFCGREKKGCVHYCYYVKWSLCSICIIIIIMTITIIIVIIIIIFFFTVRETIRNDERGEKMPRVTRSIERRNHSVDFSLQQWKLYTTIKNIARKI